MKITFIFVEIEGDQRLDFYPGLAILSAVLKSEEHEVSLIRTAKLCSEAHFIALLREHTPDLIGFSIMTNFYDKAKKYAHLIKAHLPHIPIVFGGVHPTLVPDEVAQSEGPDFICVGEGEEALSELARALENGRAPTKIKNIWAKVQENQFIANEVRPLIGDLDVLPFPDRDVFPYQDTLDSSLKRSTFMASRGCPYSCAYCCDPLKETYKRGYVRFRSVDHLIGEIEIVIKRHESEYVAFHDDILTLKRDWFEDFAKKYRKKIGLPFRCNSRVNLLDGDLVHLLKEAGCHRLNVGLESGNEYIRNKVLERNISNEQHIRVFEYCKAEGIETHTFNMVGIPYEDVSSLLDTIVFNARLKPTSVQVSYFYPYPKTKLYELCKREGFLSGKELDSWFMDTTLQLPSVSRSEIHYFFQNFERLVRLFEIVYLTPSFFAGMYKSVLISMALNHRSLIYPTSKIMGAARSIRYFFKRALHRYRRRKSFSYQ